MYKTTSLELSKQLKEAGAKQESEQWWFDHVDSDNKPKVRRCDQAPYLSNPIASAYDCAELLKRLPNGSSVKRTQSGFVAGKGKHSVEWLEATPAEALGKLYLCRLKEGHCNE